MLYKEKTKTGKEPEMDHGRGIKIGINKGINRGMKKNINKGILLGMVLLWITLMITSVSASQTSISVREVYQVGEEIHVNLSFRRKDGGEIGGVWADVNFSSSHMEYQRLLLGAGTKYRTEPGYSDAIGDTDGINSRNRMTILIYNENLVPSLSVTMVFTAVSPGETSISVKTLRAGYIDEDGNSIDLSNSSGSRSIRIEAPPQDEDEDDNGNNDNKDDGGNEQDTEKDPDNQENEQPEDPNIEEEAPEDSGDATKPDGTNQDRDNQETPDNEAGNNNTGSEGTGSQTSEEEEEERELKESTKRTLKSMAQRTYHEDLQVWILWKDISELELPEGYVIRTIEYDGETIEGAYNETLDIMLLYFSDENLEEGRFFIYREEANRISPYITLTDEAGERYTLLPWKEDIEIPKGSLGASLVIDGFEIDVWQILNQENEQLYLVYAVNASGEEALYIYNQEKNQLEPFVFEEEHRWQYPLTIDWAQISEEPEPKSTWELIKNDRKLMGIIISLVVVIVIILTLAMMLIQKLKKEKRRHKSSGK